MRVIYYFDKIRSSDAHRYPWRSISFFSPFFFPFLPLSEWDEFVCYCVCVRLTQGARVHLRVVLPGILACVCALECGWVTIGTALGNVEKR